MRVEGGEGLAEAADGGVVGAVAAFAVEEEGEQPLPGVLRVAGGREVEADAFAQVVGPLGVGVEAGFEAGGVGREEGLVLGEGLGAMAEVFEADRGAVAVVEALRAVRAAVGGGGQAAVLGARARPSARRSRTPRPARASRSPRTSPPVRAPSASSPSRCRRTPSSTRPSSAWTAASPRRPASGSSADGPVHSRRGRRTRNGGPGPKPETAVDTPGGGATSSPPPDRRTWPTGTPGTSPAVPGRPAACRRSARCSAGAPGAAGPPP